MGTRNLSELTNLAIISDHLSNGEIGLAADCLIQRWKAIESAMEDQSWSVAQLQQLIPKPSISLTGQRERLHMAKAAMTERRLWETIVKAKAGRAG